MNQRAVAERVEPHRKRNREQQRQKDHNVSVLRRFFAFHNSGLYHIKNHRSMNDLPLINSNPGVPRNHRAVRRRN